MSPKAYQPTKQQVQTKTNGCGGQAKKINNADVAGERGKVFGWSIIIRLFDFGPLRHRVDRQKYPMSNFVFHHPGQQTEWVFDLAQLLKVTMTPNESF